MTPTTARAELHSDARQPREPVRLLYTCRDIIRRVFYGLMTMGHGWVILTSLLVRQNSIFLAGTSR